MAGIGFRLQKILSEESYTSLIKGYLYSAVISAGPWLLTILAVGVIGVFSELTIGRIETDIFRVAIIYTYAFSLIFIGIIQMVITRYIADKLYLSEETLLLPIFNSLLLCALCTQFPLAAIFYYYSGVSFIFGICGIVLYLTICLLWSSMIFLSAAKDYISITAAFIVGSMVSISAGVLLGNYFGLEGIMAGFTAGQLIIAFWLVARIIIEFPSNVNFDFGFFAYYAKHYELLIIGFFYNLAIWIDKFIFWFGDTGEHISGLFYTFKIYDSSMFFAYITIVPSLALFLIRIETSFYSSYKRYYGVIINKEPLSIIYSEHQKMAESLKLSLLRLIKLQGAVTLPAIVFADKLINLLKLSFLQYSIIRIGMLGAFLQVIFLILCIILLYFDLKKETLFCTIVFFITNALFSFISLKLGFRFYGYGYFTACLISTPLAYYFLHKNMSRLEFLTFMRQPIQNQRIDEIELNNA